MSYSTVRAISSPELTYLRTAGQWSRLYLAVFQPTTIYTARLASLPSSNDRVVQVSFTSGSGTLANVLPDMTMYVGSSAGAYNLGIVRIRKAPVAGTFYIGEESEVNWQASCYLTVINEFDLWAKHITTVDDDTFYMDVDITYSDQNSTFSPIPIMGSHRVLKRTGSTISTQFNWTNSYCIGSSISSYSVVCSTASITGSTTSTPTLQFSTDGWHTVVLTVTAANGKTSVGVRYVYVYSASSLPATVFQLGSCSADYDTGGWDFTVTMQDEIELASVPERTLCILFSEDYYGDTSTSIGQLSGCENIICVGKIAEENINITPETSDITLTIHGMHHWMSQVYAFPTGVILTASTPTNWAEMQSPTIDKVLFRLLHWGCTATKIMDVYLTNDTLLGSELTSPASNLWAQIQEIAFTTIQARSGVDKFGRLFIEIEPQVVPSASRTWATVMTITEADWYEAVRMQRVVVNSTGMVNTSGVVIAASGSGSGLFSLAPGHVFGHYGLPDILDRLLLSTQSLSNSLASAIYNWKNNPYPNSEFKLSANNRMIDCFPRQRVDWSVATDDTPRGFSFSTHFIPRRVELVFDPASGFLETFVSLEMETVEGLYANGDIPGSGDYDPSEPPDPDDFPPLPDFPPIGPVDLDPTTEGGPASVLLFSVGVGLIYTPNFNDSSPSWLLVNGGLTGHKLTHANKMFVTPSGAVYVANLSKISNAQRGTDLSTAPWVARAESIGGTFTIVKDENTLWTDYPSTLNTHGICGIGFNPLLPDTVAIVQGEDTGVDASNFHIWTSTDGATFAQQVALPRIDETHAASWLTFGQNTWFYVTNRDELGQNGSYWRTNASGSVLQLAIAPNWNIAENDHIRASTTGILFAISTAALDRIRKSTDNGATWNIITPGVVNQGDVDPTGQYLMSCYNSKSKSADGGNSWSALSSLPPGGDYFFKYAGGTGITSRWIAARGIVRLSQDFGVTWENREGDIGSIDPSLDVSMIWVIAI